MIMLCNLALSVAHVFVIVLIVVVAAAAIGELNSERRSEGDHRGTSKAIYIYWVLLASHETGWQRG